MSAHRRNLDYQGAAYDGAQADGHVYASVARTEVYAFGERGLESRQRPLMG